MQSKLIFDYPFLWTTISLLTGLIYAYLLYNSKNKIWSPKINILLAISRGLAVSIIVFLLSGAVIKSIRDIVHKPLVVIGQDNSKSLGYALSKNRSNENTSQQVENLSLLADKLKNKGYDVMFSDINGQLKHEPYSEYTEQGTNISKMLKTIHNKNSASGLSAIALVSDGIYNEGINPDFDKYLTPIYSLAIGDTVPYPDIILGNIIHNKVALQGNKFPVRVSFNTHNINTKSVEVSIFRNKKKVISKNVEINKKKIYYEEYLLLEAENEGYQGYTAIILPAKEEENKKNNSQSFFINIIKEQQVIGILADAPHPNIFALKTAIQEDKNLKVKVYYVNGKRPKQNQFFDLFIINQLPTRNYNIPSWINVLIDTKVPILSIVGNLTDISKWNKINGILQLSTSQSSFDEIFLDYNTAFNLFDISDTAKNRLQDISPLLVPYGNYKQIKPINSILNQKIGKISSKRPFAAFGEHEGIKRGIIFGQDLWKWRIQEYGENGNAIAFDEIMQKMVQYLARKDSELQFKVYPVKKQVQQHENMAFYVEIYNELFEPIKNHKIKLDIYKGKKMIQSFPFSDVDSGQKLKVGQFETGAYSYTATTVINGNNHNSKGQFVISFFDKENMHIANFKVLRNIARNSGGSFFEQKDYYKWENKILSQEFKGTLSTEKKWKSIIDLPWLLIAIITLLSIEWVTRKYHGVV